MTQSVIGKKFYGIVYCFDPGSFVCLDGICQAIVGKLPIPFILTITPGAE